MADTVRTLAALQTLFQDNATGQISAQDVRDMLVSLMPTGKRAERVLAASTASDIVKKNAHIELDGVDDEADIKTALSGFSGKVRLVGGTINWNANNSPVQLTSDQELVSDLDAPIAVSGGSNNFILECDGSSTARSNIKVALNGKITINNDTVGVLKAYGDIKGISVETGDISAPVTSTAGKAFYFLGNAGLGIRGIRVKTGLIEGVGYGTINQEQAVVYFEGMCQIFDIDKLTARRVGYGLGTRFLSYNPVSVKSMGSGGSFTGRPNLSDGDLNSTATFTISAGARLLICGSHAFNAIRVFLSVYNTVQNAFPILETTPNGGTNWYQQYIKKNKTLTNSGANTIPFGKDGVIRFATVPDSEWGSSTIDGVAGYWISLRFIDKDGADIALSSSTWREIIIGAIPNTFSFDVKVIEAKKAGLHFRCASDFIGTSEIVDPSTHGVNLNSESTDNLTSDIMGAGDDDDRFFHTVDGLVFVNIINAHDTALLTRACEDCKVLGIISGVDGSAAYEQGDASASSPYKDEHKTLGCDLDLLITGAGREGVRIRGDYNNLRVHVADSGQYYSLTPSSTDKSFVHFAKGQSSAPFNNVVDLYGRDTSGRTIHAIVTDSDATQPNYIRTMSVFGVRTAIVDDQGDSLKFTGIPVTDLASQKGYNSGSDSIASGTTSKVITHGLFRTPKTHRIFITRTNNPTNDAGDIYITAIGATTFTANCRVDPGVSGLSFNWAADVTE